MSDQVVMTLLMVLGLYVLGSRAEQTKRILANNKWLVVLFIYMALSVIWSNFPGHFFSQGHPDNRRTCDGACCANGTLSL